MSANGVVYAVSAYDVVHTEIITVPRIKDKIKVEVLRGWDSPMWVVYRESPYCGWEKIPTSTRAEERKFPKSVGYAAQAIVKKFSEGRA